MADRCLLSTGNYANKVTKQTTIHHIEFKFYVNPKEDQ